MQQKLVIKLCRFGRKHKPFYRIGVMQKYRSPSKKYALEYIGWYNPVTKDFSIKEERLKHYLENNIDLTDTVRSLLIKHSLIKN